MSTPIPTRTLGRLMVLVVWTTLNLAAFFAGFILTIDGASTHDVLRLAIGVLLIAAVVGQIDFIIGRSQRRKTGHGLEPLWLALAVLGHLMLFVPLALLVWHEWTQTIP